MPLINVATAAGAPQERGASTDELDLEYKAASQSWIRSEIDQVPGSGQIRGVWMYKGLVYAFRDNETGTAGQMFKSTDSGWELITTPVLAPGGRYEFVTYNFTADADGSAMYGVDGVNLGFQFDGTTFTQNPTGISLPLDTPTHVYVHKRHLFYAYEGGNIVHSEPGLPLAWSAILGAGTFAIGQDCVGFLGVPGEAMAVFGRNATFILYGDSAFLETVGTTPWRLDTHDEESGAIEWSLQRFKQPTYLDDRGVTTLDAVQAYGDFKAGTLSQKIQKVIKQFVPLIISSLRVREKDQYRLYLSDGRILTLSMDGNKMIGATLQNYNINMVVTNSIEDDSGEEILLGGCTTGYIYRIDSGTSLDGNAVGAYIRPVFNHFKSPEHKKRFFKAVLEIDADDIMDLVFLPTFGYGNSDLPSAADQIITVLGGGGIWDSPDTFWRDFYWDSQVISEAEGYIDGVGKNLSLLIRSNGTYEKPHTLQGIIIHYSQRGIDR